MSQVTGSTTEPARPEQTRPAPRSPEQIEAEIEATRTALEGRLDALQHKVSPASLAQAARNRAMRVLQRDDGSLDPVRTSIAAGVALVLVLYVIRRRQL